MYLIVPRPDKRNPSPGPRRLTKAPSRSTLSPWERADPFTIRFAGAIYVRRDLSEFESQPRPTRQDEFPVLDLHPNEGIVGDQQIPVQVGVIDQG